MPTDNLKLIHAGPGPQGAKDLRSEITYELVQDRRSGKYAADKLQVTG